MYRLIVEIGMGTHLRKGSLFTVKAIEIRTVPIPMEHPGHNHPLAPHRDGGWACDIQIEGRSSEPTLLPRESVAPSVE